MINSKILHFCWTRLRFSITTIIKIALIIHEFRIIRYIINNNVSILLFYQMNHFKLKLQKFLRKIKTYNFFSSQEENY